MKHPGRRTEILRVQVGEPAFCANAWRSCDGDGGDGGGAVRTIESENRKFSFAQLARLVLDGRADGRTSPICYGSRTKAACCTLRALCSPPPRRPFVTSRALGEMSSKSIYSLSHVLDHKFARLLSLLCI